MTKRLMLSGALLAIACVAWFFRMAAPGPEPRPVADTPAATEAYPELARDQKIEAQPPTQSKAADQTPQGDTPGCLTERQLESHPLILKDGERLHSVATNGPQIEIFRGVSEGSLRSFAAQGDSAAMAVLGARAVMRALGLDEQRAVPWLQFEDVNMETMLPGKTFSEPALFELDEAARWFYRAAMHGRLYALRNYGEVIAARHGGPVGLGWIEDEDFRSLSSRERSALYPSNVYQNVANGIAPQLTEGALGWFGNFLTFRTEREQTIRTRLTDEFHEASVAADLPPTVVADTASPDLEVLFSQACASVIDERLRREAPED